jgi:hypothetical protein
MLQWPWIPLPGIQNPQAVLGLGSKPILSALGFFGKIFPWKVSGLTKGKATVKILEMLSKSFSNCFNAK